MAMIIYPAGQAPKKKVQSLKGMSSILESKLSEYIDNTEKTNINHEFQDYGYRLAMRLQDNTRKALYIKLSQAVPRAFMEDAAAFATDYPHAKNKGKLFMWKLHELVSEYKLTHPEFKLELGMKRKPKKAKPVKPKLPGKSKPSSKSSLQSDQQFSIFS